MIYKQELLKKQKALNIPLSTVEKDYMLGLILSSFYRHPKLKEQWVFKGGTCLKKIYIQDYRFSEDLDFTIKKDGDMDPAVIEQYLLEAFAVGKELLGLSIQNKNIKIDPFPDKKGLFIQIKVPYQSPLMPSGSLPRIKLDLTQDENLEDTPTWLPLMHAYSDEAAVSIPIQSYSLDEIFAEKCRALVQRTRPRDLYDVVNLYEKFYKGKKDTSNFTRIAKLKFKFRDLAFPDSLLHFSQEKFDETKQSWAYMLSHQLHSLEDVAQYIEKYEDVCAWLKSI